MSRSLLIALLCLLLVGCVRSTQPVLTSEQVIKMPQLAGAWVSTKQEQLQITADDDQLKVVYTDKDGKTGKFRARVGKVKDLTIVEVSPDDLPDNTSPMYAALLAPLNSFFLMSQTDPELHGKTMKPDWFKDYIAQHPDELPTIKIDKEPIVTAEPQQFQQFILKHVDQKDAWTDEFVFTRLPAEKK